jgi:hypothetical protein
MLLILELGSRIQRELTRLAEEGVCVWDNLSDFISIGRIPALRGYQPKGELFNPNIPLYEDDKKQLVAGLLYCSELLAQEIIQMQKCRLYSRQQDAQKL